MEPGSYRSHFFLNLPPVGPSRAVLLPGMLFDPLQAQPFVGFDLPDSLERDLFRKPGIGDVIFGSLLT